MANVLDLFTGDVTGEDPRIAQARSAGGQSPFLTSFLTSMEAARSSGRGKRGSAIGAGVGALAGLLAINSRGSAAAIAEQDIRSQEEFTKAFGDRLLGEQEFMAANGSPLDNQRLKLRAQTFEGLVPLLNSSDPGVRGQALAQIGQLSQQDAQHYNEINQLTETQRQERYALRQKKADSYIAEFNTLQLEQRKKEDDFREVASILSDPNTDIQAKRAAYYKYAQTSYGDATGADGARGSLFGFGFNLLKDMSADQMLSASSDAYQARLGTITPRLQAVAESLKADGFQFNAENGGVDDLNLIKDQQLRQTYTADKGNGTTYLEDAGQSFSDLISNPLGEEGTELRALIKGVSDAINKRKRIARPTNE